MMDGVPQQDNISDDAIEAWNEHVAQVELAADQVVSGENSSRVVYVHAGGLAQIVFAPLPSELLIFLAKVIKQVLH